MRRAVLLLLFAAGCGGPTGETTAVVIVAALEEVCDGGCPSPLQPPTPHDCGGAYPELGADGTSVTAVTELRPEQIAAVVETRYRVGDLERKHDSWVLGPLQSAVVTRAFGGGALYQVDETGNFSPLDAGPAVEVSMDGGVLTARYQGDTRFVIERHQVASRRPVQVETSSPDDVRNGCCASWPVFGGAIPWLALAVAGRRPRSGARGR